MNDGNDGDSDGMWESVAIKVMNEKKVSKLKSSELQSGCTEEVM